MKRFLFAALGCAAVLPAAWVSAPPANSVANAAKNTAKSASAACCGPQSTAKKTNAKQIAAAKPGATQHTSHDGHDHHAHATSTTNKTANSKQKTPEQIKQEKLDALWAKSDKSFHDGDYPKALTFHRQIVVLDPTDVESYSVAAWLMWSLGNGDEAVLHLQKGIKANPEDHEMWQALGNHYANFVKQPKAALFPYQQAVKFAPITANTQMLRRSLAHAAEGSGNLPLAAMTWRSLVNDYPEIQVNKNNLARIEAKIGAQ